MKMWPWLLDLTFGSPERERPVHLWLPVFLVWPLLALAAVLVFVVSIPVDFVLIVIGRPYHHYTRLIAGCFGLIADLRGMVVRVNADQTLIDMTLY